MSEQLNSDVPFEGPYVFRVDKTDQKPETIEHRNMKKETKRMAKNPQNKPENTETDESMEQENMSETVEEKTTEMTENERFKRYISELNLEETLEFLELLEDHRDSFLNDAKQAAREEIERRAEQLGISFEELLGIQKPSYVPVTSRKARADAGQPKPVKYKDDKGNQWTGLGRKPHWISEFEANGGDIEQFRVRD